MGSLGVLWLNINHPTGINSLLSFHVASWSRPNSHWIYINAPLIEDLLSRNRNIVIVRYAPSASCLKTLKRICNVQPAEGVSSLR